MSNDKENDSIFTSGLRCTEGCIYMVKGPIDPKSLKSKMTCRRMPPTASALMVAGPNGQGALALVTSYPEISPDTPACGEFDDGSEEEVIEGELIPGRGMN